MRLVNFTIAFFGSCFRIHPVIMSNPGAFFGFMLVYDFNRNFLYIEISLICTSSCIGSSHIIFITGLFSFVHPINKPKI